MQRSRFHLLELEAHPPPPFLADTNLLIAAMSGREPPRLTAFLAANPDLSIGAPTLAELTWIRGRLDPAHPRTAGVLATLDAALVKIDPARVLVPTAEHWSAAGTIAGQVARGLAGGGRSLATAFDRTELINDVLIAVLARDHGHTVITEDRDFDRIADALPGLRVLFYDRSPGSRAPG